jgi:hypothetical protein
MMTQLAATAYFFVLLAAAVSFVIPFLALCVLLSRRT